MYSTLLFTVESQTLLNNRAIFLYSYFSSKDGSFPLLKVLPIKLDVTHLQIKVVMFCEKSFDFQIKQREYRKVLIVQQTSSAILLIGKK